jgi:hypothetical protein
MRVVDADDLSRRAAQAAVRLEMRPWIELVSRVAREHVPGAHRFVDLAGGPYQQPAAFIRRFTLRVCTNDGESRRADVNRVGGRS